MTEIFDDIKKLYNFHFPEMDLANYLEFISESCNEKTALYGNGKKFSIKMFPSFTPTIWLNLGEPYTLEIGNETYAIKGDQDLLLIRNSVATRYNNSNDHIFSLKFFPGALETLFGIDQSRFENTIVSAETVLPAGMIASIKACDNFEQRVVKVEAFLRSRIANIKIKDHFRNLVAETIALYDSEPANNTFTLAEKLFVNSKTINRYFHRVLGISPKKYLSIHRSRKSLTGFVKDQKNFNPETFGYHDMSHFYRDMVSFTGSRMRVLK